MTYAGRASGKRIRLRLRSIFGRIRDGLQLLPALVKGGGGSAGGLELFHFGGNFFVMFELELRVVHAGLDGGDFVLGGEDSVLDAFEFGALLLGEFAGLFRGLLVGWLEGFVSFGLVLQGGFTLLAFFQVIGVVSGGDMDAVFLEGDDLVADAVEEIPVVGNAEDGAAEGREGFLKHAEGGEVEVVGGLVEDDEVAAGFENFCEHEPSAFAAGEEVDALVDAFVIEKETAEVGSRAEGFVAELDLFVSVGDFVEKGAGAVELHALLVDVVDFDAFA